MKVYLELNLSQLKALHYQLPEVIHHVTSTTDRMHLFVVKLKVAETLTAALMEQWARKEKKRLCTTKQA